MCRQLREQQAVTSQTAISMATAAATIGAKQPPSYPSHQATATAAAALQFTQGFQILTNNAASSSYLPSPSSTGVLTVTSQPVASQPYLALATQMRSLETLKQQQLPATNHVHR